LEEQLTALNRAKSADDMAKPASWRLHGPQGKEKRWSIWVNGNWRLTFTFNGEDAILVDYQDYHFLAKPHRGLGPEGATIGDPTSEHLRFPKTSRHDARRRVFSMCSVG